MTVSPLAKPASPSAAHSDYMLSVVVLVRNDVSVIQAFLKDLEAVLPAQIAFYEVLFVDLQSTDGSLALIRKFMQEHANLRLLRLSTEVDTEVGFAAGLDHCIGDHAVLMDLYLDRPEDVLRMVEIARQGTDIVVARRTGGPRWRWGRRMYYKLANRILKRHLNADESDFRLLSRKAIGALTKIKSRRRNLRYFTELMGFQKKMLDCNVHARASQFPRRGSYWRAMRRSLDLLISNSATPLRLAAGLGVLASLGNVAYLVYVLIVAIIKQHLAEGWLTTSIMMGVMFLCLFLMLSVLAEYVARILDETHRRPLYFVEFEEASNCNTLYDDKLLNVVEAE